MENNIPKDEGRGRNLGFSSKGQWFIISAVIASGAFLIISVIFRGYFATDTGKVALTDENYYFFSIKSGLNQTISISCSQGSNPAETRSITERNLREFVQFSKDNLAKIGYIAEIVFDENNWARICDADNILAMSSVKLILVKSEKAEVWEGERPEVELG